MIKKTYDGQDVVFTFPSKVYKHIFLMCMIMSEGNHEQAEHLYSIVYLNCCYNLPTADRDYQAVLPKQTLPDEKIGEPVTGRESFMSWSIILTGCALWIYALIWAVSSASQHFAGKI